MLTERQRKSIVLAYRLTPAMARVFELLLEAPMATNEMIEGTAVGDATPAKIIVYRLRCQLQGEQIVIHKRNRAGYWLDNKTKEEIFGVIKDVAASFLPAEERVARDGIEAQRGLNDIFPGDHYNGK